MTDHCRHPGHATRRDQPAIESAQHEENAEKIPDILQGKQQLWMEQRELRTSAQARGAYSIDWHLPQQQLPHSALAIPKCRTQILHTGLAEFNEVGRNAIGG